MLLCNCKAKIKKVSTAFAIALMSARLEQTVCYQLYVTQRGSIFLQLSSLQNLSASLLETLLNLMFLNKFSRTRTLLSRPITQERTKE
jgi:hypothetical protein